MRVKLLHKFWNLVFVSRMPKDPELPDDREGDCDSPTTPHKQIRILKSLEGEKRLDRIIHEFTHAAFWHLDEEQVEAFGGDLSRALWRLGYRDRD